jgi:hypothetical protein
MLDVPHHHATHNAVDPFKPDQHRRRGFARWDGFFSSQLLHKWRIAVTIVDPRIMCLMSETSDTPTVRTATATAPAPASTEAAPYRTPWVFKFAAWVAIVAGIVFIVAVVFFSGFVLGRHAGHHGGFHHKHHAMMMHPHRFGGPGGPGGPGGGPAAVQGGGPASVAPSAPGPSQIPSSVAPSRTP